MIRKVFSLLPLVLMTFGVVKAQTVQIPCATSEVLQSYKEYFPEIEKFEQELREFTNARMKQMESDRAAGKGTGFGVNDILHIPVVVHVIHDYGTQDYMTDNAVYAMIAHLNEVYAQKNTADQADIIAPFKPYIGNPKMVFHLAHKDPTGKPTTGITRRQSYLSNGGDDQAKFDQWDPASYVNIWTIQRIGRGTTGGTVLAYATPPASGASNPASDGIIAAAGTIMVSETIPHEMGHIFNLIHTWGGGAVATACNGDDEVDDTPPTTGHFGNGSPYGATAAANCGPLSLYDTSCTNNVVKISRILLDTTLSPKVDSGIKGFDYIPRTNMTLESVKIYPSNIGEEFEVTNYKQDHSGNFNVVDVYKTKNAKIGIESLGAARDTSTFITPATRSAITFTTLKYIWIDSFKIYPTTIGDTFVINLLKQNGDTFKAITGVTTTNTGAQNVPLQAFLPKSSYTLQIVRNPGLQSDSLTKSMLDDITTGGLQKYRTISGAISFDNYVDTTGQDPLNNSGSYKGRYIYFYDWSVRYDALTTVIKEAQIVPLGFKVLPDTTYRLTLTKNPGVYNDLIGGGAYVRSIPCVIDIKKDTTNGRYNLLYELQIRYGYIKNCIDYPDTVNTQNFMDYSDCKKMFTKQQVERMRAALASNVGNRANLVNETTHIRTGILDQSGGTYGLPIDLKPVPDISVENGGGLSPERTFFLCANVGDFKFKNRSWRDTLSEVQISFNKGASNPTTTQTGASIGNTISTKFSETGWVDATVTAKGTNTGDSTTEFKSVVYVADGDNKINPVNGFFMDFDKADASNPIDKWPLFNYYKNDEKWELLDNVGFYDKNSIVYRGFDKRITGTSGFIGTPKGDYDDFFTPAFDLSGMTATECRLNFMSSGASRVADSRLMKDTMLISYSTDCGQTWQTLATLSKTDIANKGVVSVEYSPLYLGDWDLKSYDIPSAARQDKVFFRFRFRPGVDDVNVNTGASYYLPGTGNNFFIDRLNISPYKLGVNTLLSDDRKMVLAPNPTNGGTQLIIKSNSHELAQVQVTDITGKVVYSIQQKLNGDITTIEIPASVIKVKGVYMVHVLAGEQRFTEKLVSY